MFRKMKVFQAEETANINVLFLYGNNRDQYVWNAVSQAVCNTNNKRGEVGGRTVGLITQGTVASATSIT